MRTPGIRIALRIAMLVGVAACNSAPPFTGKISEITLEVSHPK